MPHCSKIIDLKLERKSLVPTINERIKINDYFSNIHILTAVYIYIHKWKSRNSLFYSVLIITNDMNVLMSTDVK